MSRITHQRDTPTESTVSRIVRIETSKVSEDALHQAEAQFPGILELAFDQPTGHLAITYDAAKMVFSQALTRLAEMGIKPIDTWWFRRRTAWYDFTDNNIADQAHVKPRACCNKIPGA